MEHLSLYELSTAIAEVLAKNLEPSYWVVAEIGQIQTNQKGHCYLELVEKEDNQIKAKTRATIWSYTYRNLSTWFHGITGQNLKAGMKILFNATVQYHEVYGFSLNIRDIDAQYTLGERAKKRQEIIAQLQEDGVYEMNKELPLPVVPQQIAIISSETAAGFGDFLNQLEGNEFGYAVQVELFNSVMQGDQAETSMISAMHQVFEKVDQFDLLVIIRGGGASLDLDCFDRYDLCSHIAQFPIPVITGIGHERDETIADLVAHTKMKTPTAVAEFIISGFRRFEIALLEKFSMAAKSLHDSLDDELQSVDQMIFRFQRIAQQRLNKEENKLNSLTKNLHFANHSSLKTQEQKFENHLKNLQRAPQVLDKQANLLDYFTKELAVLDPENVLKRGYSIATIQGKNVNKIDKIAEDSEITIITSKRKIESKYLSESKRNQ